MRAAIYNGPRSIEVADRPDPVIAAPTDAVVRVVLACVCGSDLWYYRGESPHAVGSIGHEFIGVVEGVGSDVRGIAEGDLVIAPFLYSDGTCPHCQAGVTLSCVAGGSFGDGEIDGGQGEAVRVPLAGSTLVPVPGSAHSDQTLRSLLTLSDVMCTGHHAAVSAGVRPGSVVAVVGDGAVGLSAVLASARLGAERIIALSRNPARQELARAFGATDILAERGEAAIGDAEELELGSARTDGSLRPYVTMWVVRAGDELYVRSAYGPDNPWYRRAKASGVGRIRAGGVERDVTFAEAAADAHAAIDPAYHGKYDRYGPKIVGSVVGAQAEALTIRLAPRSERGSRVEEK